MTAVLSVLKVRLSTMSYEASLVTLTEAVILHCSPPQVKERYVTLMMRRMSEASQGHVEIT